MHYTTVWGYLLYLFIFPILGLICLLFKKRWVLLRRLLVIALIPVVTYYLSIFVSELKSKPLIGHFTVGDPVTCMCGHEDFLLIHEYSFYYYCPGHRERDLIGKVIRSKNIATLINNDGHIEFKIRWNGKAHYDIKNGKKTLIKQVNNPWRTWLPWFLSEDEY